MFYIYLLENKINHKKYVGQTCKNPQERWKNGYGYSHQGVIGQAIQKYGWDNFDRTILEQVQTQEEANERERYYISFYDCLAYKKRGYNVSDGGSNGYPLAGYSIEKKEQYAQRQSIIGKKRFEEHPELKEKMAIASQSYWTETNCNKRSKELKLYYATHLEKKKQITERILEHAKKRQVAVKCIETGQEFESLYAAGQWANVSGSCIGLYLQGKEKYAGIHPETHQRLHWCHPEDDIEKLKEKIYNIVCIETNERFETATEAGKKYNVDPSGLCKHLNHPEIYKSCGKHPVTQKRLHWKRI